MVSPNGFAAEGKYYYSIWENIFEIDTIYVPIKPIGKGAYGIICSAHKTETNEKVAINKILKAFKNRIDAQRNLRDISLLHHIRYDNIIGVKDSIKPSNRHILLMMFM